MCLSSKTRVISQSVMVANEIVFPIADHMLFPRLSFLCLTVAHVKTHEYAYNSNKEYHPQRHDMWSGWKKSRSSGKILADEPGDRVFLSTNLSENEASQY